MTDKRRTAYSAEWTQDQIDTFAKNLRDANPGATVRVPIPPTKPAITEPTDMSSIPTTTEIQGHLREAGEEIWRRLRAGESIGDEERSIAMQVAPYGAAHLFNEPTTNGYGFRWSLRDAFTQR